MPELKRYLAVIDDVGRSEWVEGDDHHRGQMGRLRRG